MSPTAVTSHFRLKEDDVIRLMLEFLANRDLGITQLSLERETGVFNGTFSDDVLFLRQLILDGQWDDVLQFVQPLESIEQFDSKRFKYIINKHKYLELLCLRSEAGPYQNVEVAVSEVVTCLNQLEQYCPSKEDYNELCLLLTLTSLVEHPDYKNWNPSNSRINCFKLICPLIDKYLPIDKKTETNQTSKDDRLIQLIIKGILYESCVDYCQKRATSQTKDADLKYSSLLQGTGFSNADLSLLSWLQSIPPQTFSFPFEQKTLNVDIEQLEKPTLVASWSEMILVTPIKPKVFPHSATPFTRMKATDLMSKSLTPGLVDGLSRSLMAISVGDMAAMSRSSMAATGFHLNTGSQPRKSMQTSVDKLFEEGDCVFSSSCFDALPTIHEKPSPVTEPSLTNEQNSSAKAQALPSLQSAKEQTPNTPDLWQKFKSEKQRLLQKLMDDSRQANENTPPNATYTVDQNYITPVAQTGQSRYPNPERLATSTPKPHGNHTRRNFTTPQQSPIYPPNFNASHNSSNLTFSPSQALKSQPYSSLQHQSPLQHSSKVRHKLFMKCRFALF